ncbi:MAG TPA: 6-bladed beta-propeller [Bacteroidales bacterium]|nr:6-bladed beta-propeller [Bacteroidales bacterium]
MKYHLILTSFTGRFITKRMKFCREVYHVLLMPVIGFFLLVSSCADNSRSSEKLEEIDLYGAYRERSEVPVSNIASGIEYIRLQTGEEFMLNDPHLVNVKDSLILFIGFRKIYVFNRHSGKFLQEISAFGRGPGEYSYTTNIYDEKIDLFFVNYGFNQRDTNNYQVYYAHDFEGEVIKAVSKPHVFNQDGDEMPISRFWPLDDTLYVGYIDNLSGNLPEKLVIFDRDGKLINSFPNYNTCKGYQDLNTFTISNNKGKFFNAGDTVRFYEEHTDTIFDVNYKQIKPRYRINMGELLFPYDMRISADRSEYPKYFQVNTMHESSGFLLFSVSISNFCHLAYYDKVKKETSVCNSPSETDFYRQTQFARARCTGFVNDLDDFIPVGTDKNFYINGNDEFVTVMPALEVRRWFDMNPEKATKLPEHLQAFRDINAEDNPVIVIAKLKK